MTREFFTIRHDSGLDLMTTDDFVLLGNKESTASDDTDTNNDDASNDGDEDTWNFTLFEMKDEADYSS